MLSEGIYRHFYYSAFSERRFYLEGFAYLYSPNVSIEEIERREAINLMLFSENDVKRVKLAREEGIGFLVLAKRIAAHRDLSSDNCILIYDNPHISIYQIK